MAARWSVILAAVLPTNVATGSNGFSFINPTGTIDVTDADNSISTTERLLDLNGGTAVVNISKGLALNSGGFAIAGTNGGSVTITDATIVATDGDNITIERAVSNVTINSDVTIRNASGQAAIEIANAAGNYAFTRTTTITNANDIGVLANGGAGNTSFRRIDVDGAVAGIRVIGNTGTFEVTGDGTTAGSGGLIQNTGDSGMQILTAGNVGLSFMDIRDTGTRGILISGSNNVAIQNTRIQDTGFHGIQAIQSANIRS